MLVKTIYEYFKTLENPKEILKCKMPESDYHKELKALAIPPLKLFVTDYLKEHMSAVLHIETTQELYVSLQCWCVYTGIKYDCSSAQFACRLANMRLKGMDKVLNIGEKRLKGWSFNSETRTHLGLDDVCNTQCE